MPQARNRFHTIYSVLCVAFALFALFEAIRLNWTADDAFISFRYARSFASGNGLTFNPGERVEGYTNFLWTLFLIPCEFLGRNTEIYASALGIIFYAMLLLSWFALARIYGGSSVVFLFPALCIHKHLQLFATSGLETSAFTFFVTAGSLICFFKPDKEKSNRFLNPTAGFALLALGTLTRPDGALFYGVAFLYWLTRNRQTLAVTFLRDHWPGLIALGILIVKAFYYGSLVPNTFYAKSAADSYLSQGIVYCGLYFGSYWVLGLAPFALLLKSNVRRSIAMVLALIISWVGYIAHIGGDFMFARFLIPVTPLLFFQMELALVSQKTVLRVGVAAIILLGLIFRPDPFKESIVRSNVVEEHRIYSDTARIAMRETALELKPALMDARPIIAIAGAQAAFAYYWYPLEVIETNGLTDVNIARKEINLRGLVGHEKKADLDYLIQRKVNILMRPAESNREGILWIDGIPGELSIPVYSSEVFERLTSDPAFHVMRLPKN